MNFKQVGIDKVIQNLIEIYQDHFGELHYALFSPEEKDRITSPTIEDIRQIIIDSNMRGCCFLLNQIVGSVMPVYWRSVG